jgi:hypothetical protein
MTSKRRARATTTTATGLSNRDRAAMTLAIEQMRNEPSLAGKAVRQLLRTAGLPRLATTPLFCVRCARWVCGRGRHRRARFMTTKKFRNA